MEALAQVLASSTATSYSSIPGTCCSVLNAYFQGRGYISEHIDIALW